MRVGIILLLLIITGCANRIVVVPLTPPIIEYTEAQQKQAAAELRGCACTVTKKFLGDYGATRNAIRVLNAKKGSK